MLLSAVLGVLDILGGILLIAGGFIPYGGSGFILTVAGVFIAKGILLMIYGKLGGKGGYDLGYIVGGFLDIITGILFTAMFYNIYFFIFPIMGIIMIVKGVISFVKSIV